MNTSLDYFNTNPHQLMQKLEQDGFFIVDFLSLDQKTQLKDEVVGQNWQTLDAILQKWNSCGGLIFEFLSQFKSFNKMEHIIAIRQGPDDEDGIWHDDGSRVLAYSLSLNLNPQEISGGELLFRKKESAKLEKIFPLPFGQMVVFLTGTSGYEHKVCAVTKGERIISAGWCE